MPHDIHGRLVEKGDVVLVSGYPQPDGAPAKFEAKRVHHIYEGPETCDLLVEGFDVRDGRTIHTAKQSELLVKHDGSKPSVANAESEG